MQNVLTMDMTRARGRIVAVGACEARRGAVEILRGIGYLVVEVEQALGAGVEIARREADAVLVSAGQESEALGALKILRSDQRTRALPILVELPRAEMLQGAIYEAGADELILRGRAQELTSRVDVAVRSKLLAERDAAARARLEVLVEIGRAASSSLDLDQILGRSVEMISRLLKADRCSVVLVEDGAPGFGEVVASEGHRGQKMVLDLGRYPELRRALETRSTVLVEDAQTDPLMAEVRSLIAPVGVRAVLVQPLLGDGDILGALFLRMTRQDCSFGREEMDFARAASVSIANSVRNARQHQAIRRKRDELESAYVDRYRELAEANRRLKDLNRLKDELISVCSHDLRAPLHVLLGHGRLLLDSELAVRQKASVEAMLRQGNKILELAESLLERGRGEAARLAIEPEELDLAALAGELAEEMSIVAQARRVSVACEGERVAKVFGDPVKLRQVLQNLVQNAITHAREGGQVRLEIRTQLRPDGTQAKVSVCDDGSGIPPEEIAVVFDRYRHGPGGHGLGLSICKEFVDLHGGEIWAENLPKGGCALHFTLPSYQMARHEKPASAAEAEQRHRVLVVEDEPEIAAVVSELLRTRYRVDVARDGAEGLAKARSTLPDLVVMDVFLPRLDGLDAVAALKAASDTADIPVILLSAHQGVAEKVRALNLGAVDYLAKPFNGLELLQRVEHAFKMREAELKLRHASDQLRLGGVDALTGLSNYAGLLSRCSQELARCRRHSRPVALVAFMPDRELSPEHCAKAAQLLQTAMRSFDVLAHLGGGRFLAVLPECVEAAAKVLALRVAPALERAIGGRLKIGYGSGPTEGVDSDVLISGALTSVEGWEEQSPAEVDGGRQGLAG